MIVSFPHLHTPNRGTFFFLFFLLEVVIPHFTTASLHGTSHDDATVCCWEDCDYVAKMGCMVVVHVMTHVSNIVCSCATCEGCVEMLLEKDHTCGEWVLSALYYSFFLIAGDSVCVGGRKRLVTSWLKGVVEKKREAGGRERAVHGISTHGGRGSAVCVGVALLNVW